MTSKSKDALAEVDDILAELDFDVDEVPKSEKKIARPAGGVAHTPTAAGTSSTQRTKESTNPPVSASLQRV